MLIFGPSDLLELALAVLLVVMAFVSRPWMEPIALRLAPKTGWCMLLLALLPVALRLALLPHHPVPSPDVYDEFGHLLVADTLRHFRLANPPHPLHQFFETFFVLQAPAYASIYPIGQGLVLAIGRAIFGLPWAGVLMSSATMCSLCYWMLRGWTTPGWALLGGLLAVMEFGPLNAWVDSYWGGGLAACGGCLVFGALPRVRSGGRAGGRWHAGALLGLGIGISWLCRPYETIFLILSVLAFLAKDWRSLARPAAAAAITLLPFAGLSLLQNKQVTGSWTTLPYVLSRYQYGVPAAFTWQTNPQPHLDLTREQQLQYKMQTSFRASGPETIKSYLLRLGYRVRYYRFFFLPALYVALPFFLLKLREPRFLWVALTLALFALGVNFYPFFEVHYLGALTCLFVLVSVTALDSMNQDAARLVIYLCLAHFVFWYSRSFLDRPVPGRRTAIQQQLAQSPGDQLVFVRYWPQHIFQIEWVYNDADIDHAPVVWARDLGDSEDQKLLHYYPARTAWLLEPDAMPPKLTRYQAEVQQPKVEPLKVEPPAPKAKSPTANKPPLRFEEVR
ncbi:MAG: hypothetical protein ABSE57_12990 [Bryobacteraceae bacterium]